MSQVALRVSTSTGCSRLAAAWDRWRSPAAAAAGRRQAAVYSEDDADDETLMEQEEENYDDTAQWLERADMVCQLEGELEDSCAAFSAKVPKAWRRRAW